MSVQLKYQRELEKVERENRELRKQVMLAGREKVSNKKIKVSFGEMITEESGLYNFSISICLFVFLLFLAEILDRHVQRSVGRIEWIRFELQHPGPPA